MALALEEQELEVDMPDTLVDTERCRPADSPTGPACCSADSPADLFVAPRSSGRR